MYKYSISYKAPTDVSILDILVIVQGQLHSIFKRESFQKSGREMGSTREREGKEGTK